MTTERVPQRLLERLAAGALDEETSARLMARLEEEPGGIERLEALIEENEAFLQAHPPETYVPMILARHEQESPAHARENPQVRPSLSIPRLIPLAAAAILLVLVAIFFFRSEPTPELGEPPPEAIAVTPDDDDTTAPAAPSPDPTDEPADPDEPPDGPRSLRATTHEVIAIGESRQFGVDGVTRVVVEDEELLTVGVLPDQGTLIFSARAEGQTTVEVFFGDDEAHVVQVRIAADFEGIYEPHDVALEIGDTSDLHVQGIIRVNIDNDLIVAVEMDPDDNRLLIARARSAGTTLVHLHSRDQPRPITFRFHVADPLPDSATDPLLATHREELSACAPDESGSAQVAAFVAPDGVVLTAFAEEYSLSRDAADCLVERVSSWTFPAHDLGDQAQARLLIDL